jgi:hypothetical protein
MMRLTISREPPRQAAQRLLVEMGEGSLVAGHGLILHQARGRVRAIVMRSRATSM